MTDGGSGFVLLTRRYGGGGGTIYRAGQYRYKPPESPQLLPGNAENGARKSGKLLNFFVLKMKYCFKLQGI